MGTDIATCTLHNYLSVSLSLSVCFNGHFSRWTWVSQFYWSWGCWMWWW